MGAVLPAEGAQMSDPLPAKVVDELRWLHRQRHESLRELKLAKYRREAAIANFNAACARHGLSPRTVNRLARGEYKNARGLRASH